MDYNSYNESLDRLKYFFRMRVKDPDYLKELNEIIEGSRKKKTVAIRAIHQKYIEYLKGSTDGVVKIEGEDEMWMELLHAWQ
ncbi:MULTISPECIES: hypothetical protein [unclassified Brenneria]|uniref:hypothetical protein n=1 Tax=unclassified Brenneria TaxID=2634434 RepID=UPI0029C1333F|nr:MULTISPECIES: hypothetical protein [unclassified Brenneria]MDX5631032.1 hypothetical protein [Brenneria sp. L3-3Z]MDX5698113.1 hypothetical protein [Brenneria sp. L4-2C]